MSKIHRAAVYNICSEIEAIVEESGVWFGLSDLKTTHVVTISHAEGKKLLQNLNDSMKKYTDKGTRTPRIIVIIGSTKLQKEIEEYVWELTKQGEIVLAAPFQKETKPEIEKYRETLEQIHLRKIDLADEVHVIIKDHHLGVHSAGELNYAQQHNKIIKFVEV